MKKIIVTILSLLMLVLLVLGGCSQAATAQETAQEESGDGISLKSAWSINVEGGGSAKEFTNEDAVKMDIVEITAIKTKKDGSEIEQNWKGVLLSDVLEYLGISNYKTVKVEAPDGYSKEFSIETVKDEGTILGFILDEEEITEEDGLVQLVVKSESGSSWIKNVAKISVVE